MFLVKEDRGFEVFFDCNTQSYTVFKDGKFLIGNKFKYSQVKSYVDSPAISKEQIMIGWDVYLWFEWIDKVYFIEGTTEDQVRKSLIKHDGFDPHIIVKAENE